MVLLYTFIWPIKWGPESTELPPARWGVFEFHPVLIALDVGSHVSEPSACVWIVPGTIEP